MKKITVCFLTCVMSLHSTSYIGGKLGGAISKNLSEFNNIYNVSGNYFKTKMYPVSIESRSNNALFGIFGGYRFTQFQILSPFVEGDYEYKNVDFKSGRIDFLSDLTVYSTGQSQDHVLRDEHIDTKGTHSLGITVGTFVKLADRISALLGMRFNVSFYEVSAYHILLNGTVNPINKQTKKINIYGIEPIIGGEYVVQENCSVRFTMGYNFQQSKQIVTNYIGHQSLVNLGVSAGAKIDLSAFNVRASFIYNF
jgi:hypothetical protein